MLEQNQGVGGEGGGGAEGGGGEGGGGEEGGGGAGGGRQRATYRFGQWNIRSESAIADVLACTSGGPPDLCMVSNVLVYCAAAGGEAPPASLALGGDGAPPPPPPPGRSPRRPQARPLGRSPRPREGGSARPQRRRGPALRPPGTDEASADVFATLLDPAKGGVKAVLLNERGGEQKMIELVEKRGVVVVKLLSQESAAGRDDRQLIFLPPGTTPPALSPAGPSTFPNVPYEEAKGGA